MAQKKKSATVKAQAKFIVTVVEAQGTNLAAVVMVHTVFWLRCRNAAPNNIIDDEM